jgi:hypothetical protein
VNGDVGFPRREAGVGADVEQPGEITHTKTQSGQWRARGGRREDGGGKAWVGLVGNGPNVVLEVGRNECRVEVDARGQRRRWDIREGVRLRDR